MRSYTRLFLNSAISSVRILFLTENFPPERNAAASRVYERACYWTDWKHEVTVLTGCPNFPEGRVYEGYRNRWYEVECMSGIRVVRVKTFIAPNEGVILRTLDFVSYMLSAFTAGLFQQRPDVVVATSPQFFTAVGGWALARARRLPFVFELGDLWPASITAAGVMHDNALLRLIERLELFLYGQSAAVVALSESFKHNLVTRGISPEKIHVIINGVDLRAYSWRPRDKLLAQELGLNGCFVVGYLGTHGLAHALERVLDAAALLKDVEPSVRFLFVGAGAVREGLVRAAEARGLSNVMFVHAQPKERMPAFWSLCDLALVHLKNTPLFSTVIPSKIFEAMGMGIPLLLAAPEGEATRLIRETSAGEIVPPEAPAELARAIRRLSRDRDQWRTLAEHSRIAAVQFSRERQAKEMIGVLEDVAFHRALPWPLESR